MKHTRARLAAAAIFSLAAAPVLAQEVGTIPVNGDEAAVSEEAVGMSYTYVDLGYTHVSFEAQPEHVGADMITLAGSYALPQDFLVEGLYALASYSMLETDPFSGVNEGETLETTAIQLGAGYRYPVTSSFDANAELSALRQEDKFAGASEDNTGYTLAIGGRAQLGPRVEVRSAVRRIDVDGAQTNRFELSGLYEIGSGFAAFAGVTASGDVTSVGAGGRYNFKL